MRTSRRLAIIGEVNIDKANVNEAATIVVNIDEENITIHEANIGEFHVSRFFSVKDKYHFSSFKKDFEILIEKIKKRLGFLNRNCKIYVSKKRLRDFEKIRGRGLTSVVYYYFDKGV